MSGWGIALAAVAGVVVYTVVVAAPIGVLLGRAIRRADARERRMADVVALPRWVA